MKHLFFILITVMMLCSCNKKEPDPNKGKADEIEQTDNNNDNPGCEYICSGHQVNRYYKMGDLSIREDAIKKASNGNYVITVEFVTKGFYGYRKPKADVDKFLQCAKKFGDTSSKMTFPEAIDVGFALTPFVTDIAITATEDFDETHPAGTSLSDIVEIEYLTAYPSIKNNYNSVGLKGLIEPNVDNSDPRYGVQRIHKLLKNVSKDELAMVYLHPESSEVDLRNPKYKHVLYRLSFTKAPSNAVQTITLAITSDEGVYKVSKKVAFL